MKTFKIFFGSKKALLIFAFFLNFLERNLYNEMAFNVKKINKETNYYVVKNNPHVHKYVPLKFKKGIFAFFITKTL